MALVSLWPIADRSRRRRSRRLDCPTIDARRYDMYGGVRPPVPPEEAYFDRLVDLMEIDGPGEISGLPDNWTIHLRHFYLDHAMVQEESGHASWDRFSGVNGVYGEPLSEDPPWLPSLASSELLSGPQLVIVTRFERDGNGAGRPEGEPGPTAHWAYRHSLNHLRAMGRMNSTSQALALRTWAYRPMIARWDPAALAAIRDGSRSDGLRPDDADEELWSAAWPLNLAFISDHELIDLSQHPSHIEPTVTVGQIALLRSASTIFQAGPTRWD